MNICENCKFYKTINSSATSTRTELDFGECRKHAPTHHSGVGTGYEKKLFPIVLWNNWCGEYEVKPNG